MHDPLTVACVIDPSFCRLETLYLDQEAFLKGRAPWLVHESEGLPVRVATDVDRERFESFLAERLTHPVRPVYRATS